MEAGLEANAIAGVAGPPLVNSTVTERARAANLKRIRDDEIEIERAAKRETGRVYAPGERPRAIIYFGDTGVGKSYLARLRFPSAFWRVSRDERPYHTRAARSRRLTRPSL